MLVTFDFPSNGYSEYVDHDTLMPLGETLQYHPNRAEDRRYGILELYERFVVAFVEALDRDLMASGQEPILERIAAVVGGSMGGNLALRLSERLVTAPYWLGACVAWSPASAYESFGNQDSLPGRGQEWNSIGEEAVNRALQRCMEPETDDHLPQFVALQLEGERLINDGTLGWEVGTRALGFFLAPIIGGLAITIPFVGVLAGPLLAGVVGPTVIVLLGGRGRRQH